MTQQQLSFEVPQRSRNTDPPRTQTEQILCHLQSGKAITPLESLELYGCFRLGGRIYDLKKLGYNIESKMVTVGNGKHVAEYKLVNEEKDPSHSHGQGCAETVAGS